MHPLERRLAKYLPFDNFFEAQEEFYDQASMDLKVLKPTLESEKIGISNIANLFDGETRRLYADTIHYLDYANCRLAVTFANRISKKFSIFDIPPLSFANVCASYSADSGLVKVGPPQP